MKNGKMLEIKYEVGKLNIYIGLLCIFCSSIMAVFWWGYRSGEISGRMAWFVVMMMLLFQIIFLACRYFVRSKIVFEPYQITVYRPAGRLIYHTAEIVAAEYGTKYVEGGKYTTISRFLELGFADGRKFSILHSAECPLDELVPFVRKLYSLDGILKEVNRCK